MVDESPLSFGGSGDEHLGDEVSIYAKDAPWDEALSFLREEYGLVLDLTEKRLEVRSVDESFSAH